MPKKVDSELHSKRTGRRRSLKMVVFGSAGVLAVAMAGFGFWFFRERPEKKRDLELEAKSISQTFRQPGHLGIRYYLFSPPSGPEIRAPLIVYLHGHDGGSEGVPAEVRSLVESDVQGEFPSWVLAPRVPLPYWWTAGSRQVLAGLIREIVNHYPVDPARVYLIGFSLGSTGAMHMLSEHPSYFAAAVLLSGRPLPAEELTGTPIWHMIGEHDDAFSPAAGEKMVRQLQSLGADARFTKVKNKGHGILGILGDREIHEWLFMRKNRELTLPGSP